MNSRPITVQQTEVKCCGGPTQTNLSIIEENFGNLSVCLKIVGPSQTSQCLSNSCKIHPSGCEIISSIVLFCPCVIVACDQCRPSQPSYLRHINDTRVTGHTGLKQKPDSSRQGQEFGIWNLDFWFMDFGLGLGLVNQIN